MKKKLRSVVTLLIVAAVMLFGVFANAVFAADIIPDGTDEQNSAGNGSATSAGGSLDTGWLEIVYDNDGVIFTVTPDIDSLLDLDKEGVKEIASTVVDAIKAIVFEDIKSEIGSTGGELDVDALWLMALGDYVEDHGYGPREDDETYLNFFKAAVADDYIIDDFISYICDLITITVQAHIVGVDDLPNSAEIRTAVLEAFEKEMNARIDSYVAKYVDQYILYILGDVDTPPVIPGDVDPFIEEKISEYTQDVIDSYLANVAPADEVEELVHRYLNNDITADIEAAYVEYRDNGTSAAYPELEPVIADLYVPGTSVGDACALILNELRTNPAYAGLISDMVAERVDPDYALEALHDVFAGAEQAEIDDARPKIIKVVKDFTTTEKFKDEVIFYAVDLTAEQFDIKVEGYITRFVAAYDATVAWLKSGSGQLDLDSLIRSIRKVAINDYIVWGISSNGVYEVNTDSIMDLIAELPRPSELKDYTDDQMSWTWSFDVETGFGDCAFDITLKVGGKYDEIRRLAAVIADHVDIYVGANGEYVVNITVPDELSHALLKACNSDKISDALKLKIFSMLTADGNEIYAIYNDLTFEDIIELLENVDFEGVLSSEFVSRYVDLSGLTNEEIIAKVKQYEKYFNKLMSYGSRVFNKIPDRFMDNTLMDVYNGNGNFGYEGTHTVNIESVLKQISATYGPTIASFLDKETVTVSVDLDITFEKINRVQYVHEDAVLTEGFLPAGADVEFFANVTELDGKKIIAWVNSEGNVVTEMPNEDTVLTAVTEEQYEIITGVGIDKEYDGAYHTVVVEVGHSATATYTYAWYKDGVLLDEVTASSFTVVNVSDSGTYKCIVTVSDKFGLVSKTLESDEIIVNITPVTIEINNNWQLHEDNCVYDGNEHFVEFVGLPAGVSVILSENVKVDAGNYTAIVTAVNVDPTVFDAVNYRLSYDLASLTYPWSIAPKTIDISSVEWDYSASLEYTGSELGVYLKDSTLPTEGIKAPVYINNTATVPGDYTASVIIEALNDNYVIAGSVADLDWKISQHVIYFENVTWDYTAPFTYDGNEKSVALTNLPAGFGTIYTIEYTNNAKTFAGEYIATARVVLIDTSFEVSGDIPSLTWNINKIKIDLSGADWDYDVPFTYDGSEKTVEINGLPAEITVSYTDNKFTVAGQYVASAAFDYDENMYELVNAPSLSLGWEIKKAEIDLSGASWTNGSFVYNGQAQKVEIIGLSALVTVSYENNEFTNAGSYTAKAIFAYDNANYELVNAPASEYAWSIAKAVIDLDGASWTNGSFVYNGQAQKVEIIGLSTLVTVSYENNEFTNAGSYTAKAIFAYDSANYELVNAPASEYSWSIAKAVIDLDGFVWSNTHFVYNTQEQTVVLVLPDGAVLPDGVTVTYSGNTGTNAGSYTATATIVYDDDNYEINGQVTYTTDWVIDRCVIDLSNVKWSYTEPFTYDGTTHTVYLIGLPDGVDVVYENNTGVDARNYQAKARFVYDTDNYTIDEDSIEQYGIDAIIWRINKAEIDTSGVYLPDTTVKYSQDPTVFFNIAAQGLDTLPAGVSVVYSEPVRNIGTYTVTMNFVLSSSVAKNYNVPAPITGTLTVESWLDKNFEFYDTDGNLILSVDALVGIPAEYDFVVSDIAASLQGFELANGKYASIVSAFDITFRSDGTYMPLNDTFTVKMRIPSTHKSADIVLLYIDENGEAQKLTGYRTEIDGDLYVIFNTTHFSIYAVGEYTEAPVEAEEPSMWWIWLIIILVAVIIILLIIIIVIKVRKKKDGDDDQPTGGAPEDNGTDAPEAGEPREEAPEAEPEAPVAEAEMPENNDDGAVAIIPTGETVMVRYRSSFQSRIIQADADMQDYYSQIKNALLSYKGVKSRISWNNESFNKGRIQCAKLNLKGRTITVYLALDPKEYNVNKYHFTDVSDKPKFDKVPMLMKVRSERSLKYTLELIAEMMAKLEIPAIEPQNVDYRMPYETDEELIKRGLIKVILPPGMTLDENSNVVDMNVGELIGNAKRDDAAEVDEDVIEEAPVVEEAPEKKAPAKDVDEPASDPAVAMKTLDGETVMVRYRRSFQSKIIQADDKIKDYYTRIKNALLSYKGVKSRISWGNESFNKGRIKCAKLNLKGKTLAVYLALDPNEYNVNKYHFADASGKPKFDMVPMLMKVRSERSLKYTLELIAEMMMKLEIPATEPQIVDYRMPYETDDLLVKRGLIKVILPAGMTLDENSNIVKIDVNELIGGSKRDEVALDAEEAAAAIEKSEIEAFEEVVEIAPVIEKVAPIVVETPVFVDAETADEMVSDEAAEATIEHIKLSGGSHKGKLGEINLDIICENYEDGETVTLESLKEKRLVPGNVGRIKVLARGIMKKKLIVIADKYSIQAVKMIALAGGTPEIAD